MTPAHPPLTKPSQSLDSERPFGCILCRNLKLPCSITTPCTNCDRHGRTCIYPDTHIPLIPPCGLLTDSDLLPVGKFRTRACLPCVYNSRRCDLGPFAEANAEIKECTPCRRQRVSSLQVRRDPCRGLRGKFQGLEGLDWELEVCFEWAKAWEDRLNWVLPSWGIHKSELTDVRRCNEDLLRRRGGRGNGFTHAGSLHRGRRLWTLGDNGVWRRNE